MKGVLVLLLIACGGDAKPSLPCPDPSGKNPQTQRVIGATGTAADFKMGETSWVEATWYDSTGKPCKVFPYGYFLKPRK